VTKAELAAILEPQLPTNPIVLTAGPLLGLGDHSGYSTLPERFAALGYDVYLDQDSTTSNPEIYELLWSRNPHIKGLSDKKPNAGYVRQGLFYEIANRLPGYRSIEAMERAHALPPPYGIAPKIYYEPQQHRMDLSGTVLLDFAAVSSHIGIRGVGEAVKMMRGRFRNAPMLLITHPRHVALHAPPITAASYQPQSIYEYLDMLASCRAWVGSEAGGQALAAAVRGEHDVYDESARPEIVCTATPRTFNSRGYAFRGVDYRVTSDTDTSADYHSPIEVELLKYENVCKVRKFEMAQRLV